MKAKYIYIALLSVLGVVTTSCTDYDESVDDFVVTAPESVLVVDELNELGTLKSYVDRSAHPDFKLGATVAAEEFNSEGFVNSLMSENFDEIVAENEMKYKSIVGDDGAMNFETVDALVAAAEKADLSLYGHALCWHAANNTKYLNDLIAPRLIEDPDAPAAVARYTPVTGPTSAFERVSRIVPVKGYRQPQVVRRTVQRAEMAYVDVISANFDDGAMPSEIFCANKAKGSVVDGVLEVVNAEAAAVGTAQVKFKLPADIAVGEKYKVSFKIKTSNSAPITGMKTQSADFTKTHEILNADGVCKIETTTEWQDYSTEFEATDALYSGCATIFMAFGDQATTVYLDDVVVAKEQEVTGGGETGGDQGGDTEEIVGEEMIINGDFDSCNGDVNASPANTYSGGFAAAFVDGAGKDGTTAMEYTVNSPIPANTKINFNKFVGGSTGPTNWEYTFDDVVPAEGADYYFSMDIMTDVDYTLGTANFGKLGYQNQAQVETTNRELKAGEWATVSCEVTLTDVAFTGISFVITDYTGSKITFDNVTLVRIDPNAGQGGEGGTEEIVGDEIINEGGFENIDGEWQTMKCVINSYPGGLTTKLKKETSVDGSAAMWLTVNDPGTDASNLIIKGFVCDAAEIVPADGADFYFSMDIMSETDYSVNDVVFGPTSAELTGRDLKAGEWSKVSCRVNLTEPFTTINISFKDNPGGVIAIDNISLIRIDPNAGGGGSTGGETTTEWYNMLSNGNFDGDDFASVQAGNMASTEVVEDNGSKVLKVGNSAIQTNNWDAQVHFRIADSEPDMEEGKKYTLKFKVKSDNGSTVGGGQFQSTLGGYITGASPASFNTSTEWTEVELEYTAVAGTRALTFCIGDVIDNFYFDDCFLGYEKEVTGGGEGPDEPDVPEPEYEELTDEEKTELITGAMDAWVKAMMEHTSYVKAWDVINEAIQDEDPTKLRNGEDNETTGDNFYWSDYMGDTYVRDIVKMARTYGGDDLVLFANDYGLEYSDAKLEALIDWIAYWEEDGTTKIDGIGTQMHTSCSVDATEQAKIEEGVVNMFTKLAATGKLIKISELDITVKGVDGTELTTADMTFETNILLANFYEFVISKYFELIPAAQQYGINHWTVINNKAGWRAGLPAGLWASSYERTIPYAGYVNGLQKGAADFVIDAVEEIINAGEVVVE